MAIGDEDSRRRVPQGDHMKQNRSADDRFVHKHFAILVGVDWIN